MLSVGFGVHLINGWILAFVYAAAFQSWRLATWWLGSSVGLVHVLVRVAGSHGRLLPGLHPSRVHPCTFAFVITFDLMNSSRPGRGAAPGSGLFVGLLSTEAAGQRSAILGYLFAVAAACISGVSVFVNSLGVRTFADPVVYTALKDGLVGFVLLVPLCFSSGWRSEYRHLGTKTWAWLIALALTGGSVPFALFYSGLQMTTAATGALVNHFQFVLVALFAAAFLKERLPAVVWTGMIVLLIGTVLGTNLETLQWNGGSVLIALSTVLFAIDFVIAKYLLRGLATLTVMTARMTLGTAMLFAYVITSGRMVPLTQLNQTQWLFLVVTAFLLLLFTATTFTAIRHSSVSAVLAIGAAAPIITTCLQLIANGNVRLAPADYTGLAVTFTAVAAIIVFGIRQDRVRLSDSQ